MTKFNKEAYAGLLQRLDAAEGRAAAEQDGTAVADHQAEIRGIHTELAALHLEQLQPGRQPLSLFKQFCRLTVLPTIEIIGVRDNKGETEALITQRADDDAFWPGLVHVPGSAVLTTDTVDNYHDISGVAGRVLAEMSGSIEVVDNTVHFLELRRSIGDRGHEISPIFWAEVAVTDEERLAAARGRFVTRAAMGEISSEQLYDVHRNQLDRAMNAFEAPWLTYPSNSYILDYQI